MNRFEYYSKVQEYQEKHLEHHGIIGMHWGVRRYQNPDGTYTEEGKERYFGKTNSGSTDEIISGPRGNKFKQKYQYANGDLTRKGKEYLESHPNKANKKINMELYDKYNIEEAERKEKERKEQEAKYAEDKKILDKIRSGIKTDKDISGDEITDEEFKKIIKEVDNFRVSKYEKEHKSDYNNVADIGMDALNRSDGYHDLNLGNDSDREWFMYEDQTIGMPALAYLYYKGYSKNYVNQYLNKSVSYDEEKNYTDEEYSGGFFVRDEYHGGNGYINALYDKDYGVTNMRYKLR